MTVGWLTGFVGMAALYALVATTILLAGARLAGRFPGWNVLPLMLSTLFFVFLTLHPFPAPASISCPAASGRPNVVPFDYWPNVVDLWRSGAGPMAWLGNKLILSTLMNYLLCVVIGIALARHVRRLRTVVLAALALTLTVELTQLTGLWGIYPCAIRQFNVDDLILNSLGVVSGYLLMHLPIGRSPKARKL